MFLRYVSFGVYEVRKIRSLERYAYCFSASYGPDTVCTKFVRYVPKLLFSGFYEVPKIGSYHTFPPVSEAVREIRSCDILPAACDACKIHS